MTNHTPVQLTTLVLSPEEHAALAALLYSGLTNEVLDRLGLKRVQEVLSSAYNGPWEYDQKKQKAKTLETYGVFGMIRGQGESQ